MGNPKKGASSLIIGGNKISLIKSHYWWESQLVLVRIKRVKKERRGEQMIDEGGK